MKNIVPKLLLISLAAYLVIYATPLESKQSYLVKAQAIDISQVVVSDPIVITNDATLENQATSGSGTFDDPYIISNREIELDNTQHGILISGTSKYFEITNNFILTGDTAGIYGILVSNVANGTAKIMRNVLDSNYVGIRLDSSPYSVVSQNDISNNRKFGIELLDGSENSIIEHNNIEFALEVGINVEGGNSSILNNRIFTEFNDNFPSIGLGIHRDNIIVKNNYVEGYSLGIEISPTSNIIVSNNTINGSASGIAGWPNYSLISDNTIQNGMIGGDGIRLQGELTYNTDNNTIINNRIENFPRHGFFAFNNSNNNQIKFNIFINNNYDVVSQSQAFDDSFSNVVEQNYWDDWVSPDANNDGIVDIPYALDGGSNNIDSQPAVSMEYLQALNNQETDTLEPNNVDEKIEEKATDELMSSYLVLNPLVLISAFMVVLAIPVIKIVKLMANNTTTRLISGTLTDMIGFAPPFLIGVINNNQDNTEEFQELVPSELKAFKFLLNPIKLSIIKMLHTYSTYPAYMVREVLQISWGKFSSHVNSLIDNGYISAQEEFYEGSPTKILRIEYLGTTKYQELREMLKKMFEIVEE